MVRSQDKQRASFGGSVHSKLDFGLSCSLAWRDNGALIMVRRDVEKG